MRDEFTCHRCGSDLDRIEVTMFGDSEPRYVPGLACDCPGPRCPLCNSRIDKHTATTSPGECPNADCALWGTIIPLPVVA